MYFTKHLKLSHFQLFDRVIDWNTKNIVTIIRKGHKDFVPFYPKQPCCGYWSSYELESVAQEGSYIRMLSGYWTQFESRPNCKVWGLSPTSKAWDSNVGYVWTWVLWSQWPAFVVWFSQCSYQLVSKTSPTFNCKWAAVVVVVMLAL